MPVRHGKDSKGPYYKWGSEGTKYYYKIDSERSKKIAMGKAAKQGAAIKINEVKN